MIIAIDGPAGAGKSTTAQEVAKKLGFIHINTGAMYRAVTLKIIRRNLQLHDENEIVKLLNTTSLSFIGSNIQLDGKDVSKEVLFSEVTEYVSAVSAIPIIRHRLVEYQRQISTGNDVVLEGRDIGTVVFPNAEFKFYITADIEVRAKRRKIDLNTAGDNVSLKENLNFLKNRDAKDSSRKHSPLLKAKDAIEVDTTHLSIDQQVNCIVNIVNNNKTGA
tara:strand:+ start:2371 stop:3027 length:657 start_codon:yes stop_codon:yes gene_type:complete